MTIDPAQLDAIITAINNGAMAVCGITASLLVAMTWRY